MSMYSLDYAGTMLSSQNVILADIQEGYAFVSRDTLPRYADFAISYRPFGEHSYLLCQFDI